MRTLAVFDFDGTLIEGDSLWPFLTYVAGWPATLVAFLATFFDLALRYARDKEDPTIVDPRTYLKAQLLIRLLSGKSRSEIAVATGRLVSWRVWKEDIHQKLLDHSREGHHIVIASGGLDLYLPELLKDMPPHALLCTEIETIGDTVTGVMQGGNCVRQTKADVVAAYMRDHGPFDVSWGYGNYPHDLPMLALLTHRIIV